MLCFLKHNSLCPRVVYSKSFPAMQPVRSGSSVAYSDTKWTDICLAEPQTKLDLDWAFEADHADTDFERDPSAEDAGDDERYGADSAVANPNDGEQDVEDHRPSSKKLYAQRSKMQVFHTCRILIPNDKHLHGTTAAIRNTRCVAEKAPCRYGMRDVHMATYVLGAGADPMKLVNALRQTGIPIIVLVFTRAVCELHDIYKDLKYWAATAQKFHGRTPPEGSDEEAVLERLEDKRIVALGENGDIFACLHKGRVQTATFEERVLSCGEQESDENVQFGTLTVHFHEGGADPGDYVRIGVVVTRDRLTDEQVDGLAQWIILHRLAVLTGFLAHSHDQRNVSRDEFSRDSPVTMLAQRTRAVGSDPLFQTVDLAESPERKIWAIPVPWMFFGYEKAIKQPVSVARPWIDAEGLDLGSDVCQELVSHEYIPYWEPNREGNAYVPFLDVIRMTKTNWEHWFDGCFMTAVRIGRSVTPRRRYRQHARKIQPEHVERKRIRRDRDHADEEQD